jgi:Putative bacterial sensory transduction regulator
MATREDVESFLLRTDLDYEEVREGMWIAKSGDDGPAVVVDYAPPVLVFRLKVMDEPGDPSRCAELYKTLLQFNASDLVHGAYGLEEGDVILTETLELENLDFNEFQATLDSFQVALASHREALTPFLNC